MLLIVTVVIVFEVFFFYTTKHYYYTSIESVLKNHAMYCAEVYTSYFSDYKIETVVMEDKDQFYRNILDNYQIQILNNSGVVLLDNIDSSKVGEILDSNDIEIVKKGSVGRNIYRSETNENIMSISTPLKNRNNQVGALRISISLKKVDSAISKVMLGTIAFGIFLVLLGLIICLIISNYFINPLIKLKNIALKIGEGNFDVLADETMDGELGSLAKTMNVMSSSIVNKENLKNEFISSISHELRTPLTIIKGWAITLQSESDKNTIVGEGLMLIEKESDRLTNMVEELLDFSRLSSGRMELKVSEINLSEIAKLVNKQLQFRAKTGGIDIVVNYDEEPVIIMADKDRIKQILINLLDNALKFTESGGVIITNITQDENNAVLEVIDTGIGIKSEEISLITGKFYKGGSSNSHTGLGLSICEEIIKLHGGNMTITSKIGEGTSVRVVLPKRKMNNEI